jgi:chorismate dehydratase
VAAAAGLRGGERCLRRVPRAGTEREAVFPRAAVPPAAVRRLALDEGSRTSVALAQILLEELAGVTPQCEPLPIGCGLESTDADAVLLIGDRAIQSLASPAVEIWDLGQRWYDWTGLPFVFAAWVARPEIGTTELETLLAGARDRGVAHLAEIAAAEALTLGISTELAVRYLRDSLHFALGEQELKGLRRFARLCAERGLVPKDAVRSLNQFTTHGCTDR